MASNVIPDSKHPNNAAHCATCDNIKSVSDLSLDQTAHELGCSRDTVRRMIARGELKAYRVGKRLIRIRRRDLERAMRPVTRVDLVTAGGDSA